MRMRPDMADTSRAAWQDWLDRTSLAFVEIVLSESLHAPDDLVDVLDALEEEHLAGLERHGVRLPLPASPLGEEPVSGLAALRTLMPPPLRVDHRRTTPAAAAPSARRGPARVSRWRCAGSPTA
ncbi:hypothetical protein ACF08N_07470 [Streptomyces sp. NPDC015127]|uniref:hypothetical protein n=1 Tax=Streptomyces sp. NPDC015127 TaxID=3364939 RepID=UPI0036F51861